MAKSNMLGYLCHPSKWWFQLKKKLLEIPSSTETVLLQSIPKANDSHWSKEIYKIPKITFSTIYQFLVERKALVQKADMLITS